MRAAALLSFAALLTASLATAQWPPYLGPGVPRTAAGAPDLTAPAPRLANGKPDFSGVWESRIPPSGRLGGLMVPSIGEAPPLATFVDVAANMPQGLPLTAWGEQVRKERLASFSTGNPDAHCLPLGFMQLQTHSQPRKIVHTASLMLITYEANYGLRQIFVDGRALPDNDPQPWWDGYSVGSWDHDTLVVDTVGFRDGGWLDVNGNPFTSATRLTERFRRVSYGRLEIDLTIDDRKAYTRPWTVRVNWRLIPDQQLIEFICNENQQFPQHAVK
jgi:hypothetical protein